MDLPANEICDILKSKDVRGLYHANTVRTSKTFLENGGLLSRKYIEDNGLIQTYQKSDDKDKKFEIWDHIFLDAINISKYFSRYNKYGHVLFGFRIDLLKSSKVKTVRITKMNPIYWNDGHSEADKYFQTVSDFSLKFKSGDKLNDGGYHITFTTLNGVLDFEYLFGIQIDDPGVYIEDDKGVKVSLSERTIDYFSEDLKRNSLIEKIETKDSLLLKWQYQLMNKYRHEEFKKLFGRNG